jgi:hypothetical protein
MMKKQRPDGYLGTYYEEDASIYEDYNAWGTACAMRGLIAFYEATGRTDVLNAVYRCMLWFCENWTGEKKTSYSGPFIMEPMVFCYYHTGDERLIRFCEDYQGNIWLASSHYGVIKLSESPFINMFEKNGVEGEVVNAVVQYDGYYFCGTDNGLLVLDSNGLSNSYGELVSAVEGSRVRSLLVDSKDRLWLCTYNGLFCCDKQSGITVYNMENNGTTSDRFRCITELKDGTIVTGTADGINFIKDGKVAVMLTAEDGLENTQMLLF